MYAKTDKSKSLSITGMFLQFMLFGAKETGLNSKIVKIKENFPTKTLKLEKKISYSISEQFSDLQLYMMHQIFMPVRLVLLST